MHDDPIIHVFLEEAGERLAELERDVLELERNPRDVEILHRVFRCAHTLKGNSGMLGLDDVARFTHALEDLLDELRKERRAVTPEVVGVLLRSSDVLKDLVAAAGGARAADAHSGDAVLSAIRTLLSSPPSTNERLASDARPANGTSRAGGAPHSSVATNAPARANGPARGAPGSCDSVRASQVDAKDSRGQRLTDTARRARSALGHATSVGASVRVPIEKIDRLVELAGELAVTHSIVAHAVQRLAPREAAELRDAVARMDHHARELHDRLMAVRRVPIRVLFARFTRLVRDLANTTGKLVELETSGREIELDQSVIERISAPLTQLVRNAVDHGVESPSERADSGKHAAATIRLRAYERRGSVCIDVEDDGRGIDCERVRATAVRNGRIAPDAELPRQDVVALIFEPGLSTAASVTEISGRGVGLDVVKRGLESLGGAISVQSDDGRGTRFRIEVPSVLAIVGGQTVRVGDALYVVPLSAITDSFRPVAGSVRATDGSPPIAEVRDRALPIVVLHELFGTGSRTRDPLDGRLIVVDCDGRAACLLVDELLGQQQFVVTSMANGRNAAAGITGATLLRDGRAASVLDVAGILDLALRGSHALARRSIVDRDEP